MTKVKMMVLCWSLICLAVFTPARALSIDESKHLLSRTGFGLNMAEIEKLRQLSYPLAVEAILASNSQAPLKLPAEILETFPSGKLFRDMAVEQKQQVRKKMRQAAWKYKGWWMQQMIATNAPFVERMTLFWHNHFTSSFKKVKHPVLMKRQHELIRSRALGNFADFIHAIARDPAMIIYLDNISNVKGKPNENFARELLELFSLGEGQYSEQDIKEAARAFTGWSVNRKTGEFLLRKRQHDYGVKSFLGEQGKFDGDDIMRIILEQSRTAEHIAEKLVNEFVSREYQPGLVNRMATKFREQNYDIKAVLRVMLNSNEFKSKAGKGDLIKSPVELIVGTLRTLELRPDIYGGDGVMLARVSARLGQNIFDPPNVKGWPGDLNWIDSRTLVARQNMISRLMRGSDQKMTSNSMSSSGSRKMGSMTLHTRPNAANLVSKWGRDELVKGLLVTDAVDLKTDAPQDFRFVADIMRDPVYQLK